MSAMKAVSRMWLRATRSARDLLEDRSAIAATEFAVIVPIYEVGQHEGQHYFSMKLIEGGSLGACE